MEKRWIALVQQLLHQPVPVKRISKKEHERFAREGNEAASCERAWSMIQTKFDNDSGPGRDAKRALFNRYDRLWGGKRAHAPTLPRQCWHCIMSL